MEYCCKLLNNSKITGGYLQSRTVDRLRLPLTVMVVFIHSFFSYPVGDASYIGLMIYECVRIFFSHVVSHIAVPVFFLVSGYYFFYGSGGGLHDEGLWVEMVKKGQLSSGSLPAVESGIHYFRDHYPCVPYICIRHRRHDVIVQLVHGVDSRDRLP